MNAQILCWLQPDEWKPYATWQLQQRGIATHSDRRRRLGGGARINVVSNRKALPTSKAQFKEMLIFDLLQNKRQ